MAGRHRYTAQAAGDRDETGGNSRVRGSLERRLAGRTGLRAREAQDSKRRDLLRGKPASVRGMPWWAGPLQEVTSMVKKDREGVWRAG